LNRAFEHTREAQIETAMKNKARSTRNCTDPEYKVGDMLYLWEKSSEESRLRHEIREIEGHKGRKLPSKLVNPWGGPYKVVKILDKRYCVIDKGGHEVKHNVNRLAKQHRWDEWHADTAEPFGPLLKDKPMIAPGLEKAQKSRDVKAGETIVFPMNMSDLHPLPFGVGRVVEVKDRQDLRFQWLGNRTCLANGVFHPAWISSKDNKFYYKPERSHNTHKPFLGEHSDVIIGTDDLLAHGYDVLDEATRLSREIREKISQSVWVKQAWGAERFSFSMLGD